MSKKSQKSSQQQQSKVAAPVAASDQQDQQQQRDIGSDQQRQLLAVTKAADQVGAGLELGTGQAARKRPKLMKQTASDKVEALDGQVDARLSISMLSNNNSNSNNNNNNGEALKQKCDSAEKTILIKQEIQQEQQQQRKPMTDSKQNICAACSKPIKERYLLMVLGKQWHEDCLKCACCDCRLGEVGSSLFTHSDKILCRRDFLRIFGQHGNCAACKRSIPPYELVMRANDNAYHMDCFACQRCQYRFCVGDRFHLTETHKISCLLCHTDQQHHQLQDSTSLPANATAASTATATTTATVPAPTGDEYQPNQTPASGGDFVELSRLEPAPRPPPQTSDIDPAVSGPAPTVTNSGGGAALIAKNTPPPAPTATGQLQQASPSQASSCPSHQQQAPNRTAAAGS